MVAPQKLTWAALAATLLAATPLPAADTTRPTGDGVKYFASRLADDAREALRNPRVDPMTAAQAAILLQYAVKLDDSDRAALKLLVDAAQASGNPGLQREALRKLISQDKGDLVAQVQYLDLLAGQSQQLDERSKVYEGALGKEALDAQIRSEMALRLAQIAEERGQADAQKAYLDKAVALNNVNVGALRGLVRLAAQNPRAIPERLAALIALLAVDPYQPDAWLDMARIGENANMHDRAADNLITAMEQMQLQGAPPVGTLYLELAIEQAIAGRRVEAKQMADALSRLPDAPPVALLLVGLLKDAVPATQAAPGIAAAASQPEDVAPRIEKQLAELTKNGAATALADAAGVELTVMPTVGPDTAKWIDAYAALVAPEDVTLGRLRGWQLYRDGKLDDAKATLEKVADSDPMARVGLARIAIDQGKKQDAAKFLQELWSEHPTGLLALQVTETARRGSITLADTQWTKQLRDVESKLPTWAAVAHRQPREIQLISPNIKHSSVGSLDPILVTVRMSNVSDRPLPTGPNGVFLTTVGLAAVTREAKPVSLGMYALADLQRAYRIEPKGVIEATVRVDQGIVADLFESHPMQGYTLGITAATAPQITMNKEMVPRLGGQLLAAGDIQRPVLFIVSPANFDQFLKDVTGLKGDRQLLQITAADVLLGTLLSPETGNKDAKTLASEKSVKERLVKTLAPLAASRDPLVRAALVRALPTVTTDEALDKAVEGLAADDHPLVRLMWAVREGKMALQGGELGNNAIAALQARSAIEKDSDVKDWVNFMIQRAKPATTQPAG